MIQTVIKRDGRIVGYNEEKIKAAIRKAMLQSDRGEDERLIQRITDRIGMTGGEQMEVEAIQDLVEMELMKSTRKEVAKLYIAYRNKRRIARQAKMHDNVFDIIFFGYKCISDGESVYDTNILRLTLNDG